MTAGLLSAMKLRPLIITVAVLALLSAAAWYLRRPADRTGQDQRVSRPVLDTTVIDNVAKVRITDEENTLLLVKQNDMWIVENYHGLQADFERFTRLIEGLAEAKVDRFVTSDPGRLERLEFKNSTMAFLDPAGNELWSLTVGKADEYGGRFIKFGDERKAYLSHVTPFTTVDAKTWAHSFILELAPKDVAKVEVDFPSGEPVVASRPKAEDAWTADKTPAGRRVKGDKIAYVITTLGQLRFQDTFDPADPTVAAAHANLRTVRFTTFDGKTIAVQVGREPEEMKPESSASSLAESKPADAASSSADTETSSSTEAPAEPEQAKDRPVFAFITHSDPDARINALMQKRAFRVYDWTFTSLPAKPDELFEPLPETPSADEKQDAAASAGEKSDTVPAPEEKPAPGQ